MGRTGEGKPGSRKWQQIGGGGQTSRKFITKEFIIKKEDGSDRIRLHAKPDSLKDKEEGTVNWGQKRLFAGRKNRKGRKVCKIREAQ